MRRISPSRVGVRCCPKALCYPAAFRRVYLFPPPSRPYVTVLTFLLVSTSRRPSTKSARKAFLRRSSLPSQVVFAYGWEVNVADAARFFTSQGNLRRRERERPLPYELPQLLLSDGHRSRRGSQGVIVAVDNDWSHRISHVLAPRQKQKQRPFLVYRFVVIQFLRNASDVAIPHRRGKASNASSSGRGHAESGGRRA